MEHAPCFMNPETIQCQGPSRKNEMRHQNALGELEKEREARRDTKKKCRIHAGRECLEDIKPKTLSENEAWSSYRLNKIERKKQTIGTMALAKEK